MGCVEERVFAEVEGQDRFIYLPGFVGHDVGRGGTCLHPALLLLRAGLVAKLSPFQVFHLLKII